jgi:hypothetical protein
MDFSGPFQRLAMQLAHTKPIVLIKKILRVLG